MSKRNVTSYFMQGECTFILAGGVYCKCKTKTYYAKDQDNRKVRYYRPHCPEHTILIAAWEAED